MVLSNKGEATINDLSFFLRSINLLIPGFKAKFVAIEIYSSLFLATKSIKPAFLLMLYPEEAVY